MLAKIFFSIVICSRIASGYEGFRIESFLEASPLHPQIRVPDVPPGPDNNAPRIVNNEFYDGGFNPTEGCSFNRTDLKLGDTGTITTPNYPKNYPASQSCQWYLESEPGTRIEATFFDLVTQPWFFTYFDYVMIAKSGNFSMVDRIAGDMNGKTPMTVSSDENAFGVRFRSSSLFSFRGMKLQYLVRPADPSLEPLVESSPYVDNCGLSQILIAEATATPPPADAVPIDNIPTAPGSDVPVLIPGGSSNGSRFIYPTQSPFEFNPKIIGYSPAPKHAYPWMVALLIDGRHFCGGSLIDSQHVLTAAHCTDNAKKITMLFGSHDIKAPAATEPSRVVINVTSDDIFQHPEYNPNTISNDISIIRLPQKLQLNDQIRPVCLPNKYYLSKTFTGESVRVTGWGKNSDKAPSVNPQLQQAGVKVMPNGQCRNFFRGIVTGNLICISTTRQISPCKGDSGGPLVVEQQGPAGPYFMQLGVVSFGSFTCERGFPVGFTRTTAYLDYISQVTGRQLV